MFSESASNALLLALNVGSTVGIVLVNKLVLRSLPFAMVLTLCHTIVSSSLICTRARRWRPEKPAPWYVNWWMACLVLGCIYLQNVSLRINTVTFYQMSKLMVIPTQCLYQYFSQSQVFSIYVYSSLAVLTFGVGLSTVAEFKTEIRISGIVVAALAVFSVVLEQAETARLRKKYQRTSTDHWLSVGPHRTMLAVLVVLGSERDALPILRNLPVQTWGWLFLSCLFATSINVTVVEIVGKFGPVTTAVVGHVKTMSILLVGFFLTPPTLDSILAKRLTGIIVALAATIKYGQYNSFPEADCFARCRYQNHRFPHISVDSQESKAQSLVTALSMKKVLLAVVMVVIAMSLLSITPTRSNDMGWMGMQQGDG